MRNQCDGSDRRQRGKGDEIAGGLRENADHRGSLKEEHTELVQA